MAFPITQAPGGGTSIGQALGGVLDDANKDKLALQALKMPGIRESMGDDVFNFITKGPGVHKRFGDFMARADRLSGGKVSKMNRIVQSVSNALKGRQNVAPEEVLQIGLAAADAENQANPQTPEVTVEDVNKLHSQLFQGVGRTRAAGRTARLTDDQKIANANKVPAYKDLIAKDLEWETMSAAQKQIAIRSLGDSNLAKRQFSRGSGDDLTNILRKLSRQKGDDDTTTGITIRVIRKSDGQPGSIPESEFDPAIYDKE